MEPIVWVFLIPVIIGAIAVGLLGIAALIGYWWLIIPIIGAYAGGWIGFLFALGLVVIIGVVVLAFKS